MTERQLFFEKHINIIKENRCKCQECGDRLFGIHGEIAHILNKSYFKSVELEDDNVIYLCGQFSKNNCHGKLDNTKLSIVKEMNIYNTLCERYNILKEKVREKINYKIDERFGS